MFGLFRRQTSFGKEHKAPRCPQPQRTTLQVEELEERAVPSIDVVTNNNNTGPGSLRKTIFYANPGDTIEFGPGVVSPITITSPIVTNLALTITGPGSGALTVDAQKNSGIFYFNGSAGTKVTVSGLTLKNGNSSAQAGGAIFSTVDLTLNNTVLTGNTSIGSGGAVYESGGSLTIMNSQFSSNYAFNGGGAVADYGGGPLKISNNCSFSQNTAYDEGGAVLVGNDSAAPVSTIAVTIQDSTFTGNTALVKEVGYGGAICDYAPGSLNISTSYFGQNKSYFDGGALFAGPSLGGSAITNTLTIQDSTFTGNIALASSGGGVGGAICDYANGTLSISGTHFTGNTAYAAGGAVHAGLDYSLPEGSGPAQISVYIEGSTFTDNSVPKAKRTARRCRRCFLRQRHPQHQRLQIHQ